MLDISEHTRKFINKLQSKEYKQIVGKLFDLSNDPVPTDSKHLSGRPGYLRVDSGEYRILYTFEKSITRIELIGKRNDDEFYDELERLVRK